MCRIFNFLTDLAPSGTLSVLFDTFKYFLGTLKYLLMFLGTFQQLWRTCDSFGYTKAEKVAKAF